jgi:CheY-like chemotaxis protein
MEIEVASTHLPRILLVEDNEEIRLLITLSLKGRYEVVSTAAIAEALHAAALQTVDLYLIDLHLGGHEDGRDCLRALRAIESGRAIPAVACTAYASPLARRTILEEGFDGLIAKPFTRTELIEGLHRILKGEVQNIDRRFELDSHGLS